MEPPNQPIRLDIDHLQLSLLTRLQNPQYTLTSLTASHGYGKSTLLGRLAQSPDATLLRLLDVDPDPTSLIRALAEQLPEHPEHPSKLTYELTRPDLTPRAASLAFREKLLQAAPHTLLIDDLQAIPRETRRWLTDALLAQLPADIRVILTVTDANVFSLRPLRPAYRQRIQEITEQDLRLTEYQMMHLGLNEQQRKLTQGWPAAVEMACLGYDPEEPALQLLRQLDPDLLATLRRASVLPTWRRGDPIYEAIDLPDGWLEAARAAGIPMTTVSKDAWQVHPLIQQELITLLRDRPQEYRNTFNALAEAQYDQQPIAAVNAYLEAENESAASYLLLHTATHLRESEQVESALTQLKTLAKTPEDPLYLAYAQAVFESGSHVRGLNEIQRVLNATSSDPQLRSDAFATLANMRLKLGNTLLAAQFFKQALQRAPDARIANRYRSQLALTLAMHTRLTGPEYALQAEAEAKQVLIAEVGDTPIDHLQAQTALVLAEAARGQRETSRLNASFALASLQGLRPDHDVLRCVALIAGYYADDHQPDEARKLLKYIYDSNPTLDSLVLTHLVEARLALWAGQVDQAARHAQQAADQAQLQDNQGLELEGLILASITTLFPDGAHPTIFHRLESRFGSRPGIGSFLNILRHRLNLTSSTLPDDLPLELQVLLSVNTFKTVNPGSAAALQEAELVGYRDRVGAGVVWGYARLLGVDLPKRLAPADYALHITCLCPVPTLRINGRRLTLSPQLTLILLVLALSLGPGETLSTQDGALLFPDGSPSQLSNLFYRLRQAIDPLTEPDILLAGRGQLSLKAFRVQTDLHALEFGPIDRLAELYESAIFASYPEVPGESLINIREQARTIVRTRLLLWEHINPQASAHVAKLLQKRDPQL